MLAPCTPATPVLLRHAGSGQLIAGHVVYRAVRPATGADDTLVVATEGGRILADPDAIEVWGDPGAHAGLEVDHHGASSGL